METSLTGAVQLWIPTALVCAAVAVAVRRRQRAPGLLRASSMAALACIAFLNAVTTWFLGLAQPGLDIEESCVSRTGSFDDTWNAAHYLESQRLFPLHAKCGATVDLVPAWVNPTIVVLLLLSGGCLCAAAFLTVRGFARRRVPGPTGARLPGTSA
ncbi:hypothetical protein [Streptomyces sp. NPDC049944]|uniref:hypothetical protein n=1 Tax=Streptomyces sp. NPDC049944 TaxID=3155657 RepID=UPI0034477F60